MIREKKYPPGRVLIPLHIVHNPSNTFTILKFSFFHSIILIILIQFFLLYIDQMESIIRKVEARIK